MSESLAGKRVLITGASSGIGAATARMLKDAGAHVFATGRNGDGLAEIACGIETKACDLTAPGAAAALSAWIGECDILVANAGRLKHAPFLESDPADWGPVFDLNVLATLALVQPVARGMVARGQGHIVLVSSLLARRASRNTLVYTASKHAVAGIAAGLRLELGPLGVRVTEVAPGLVRTRIFREIEHPAVQSAYAAMMFDFLPPEDVASVILAAIAAPPSASLDLIEIRPPGQP
jgi:NADP-dependent 3-hydroxy acid dehydrogenase YdfG